MVKRMLVVLTGLLFTLSTVGMAYGQDKKKGKWEKKDYKKFKKLGKNVVLEFTAESEDSTETFTLNLASNYFQAKKQAKDSSLTLQGQLSLNDGGYLVTCQADWYKFGSGDEDKTDLMVKASVLMKDGEEMLFGKSGDIVFKLKATEVK